MALGARLVMASLAAVAACSFQHGASSADGGGTVADGDALPPGHTRPLTVQASEVIGGPHANFPMLVSLMAPWLRDVANGGDVHSPQGFDIVFSDDAAGTVRLSHEVELYQPDMGVLIAWVKVPSLTSSTTIYVHYGSDAQTTSQQDVAGVWSEGYAAVWHLGTDLGDSVVGGATPGTNGNSADAAGQIAAGRTFNGTDSYVDLGADARIENVFDGGGTAEVWCNATTFGENSRGRVFDKGDAVGGGTTTGWLLAVDTYNVTSSVLFDMSASTQHGEWNAPASSFVPGSWTHIAVTFDSSSITNQPLMYLGGMPVTLAENVVWSGTPGADTGLALRLGNRVPGDRTFDGVLDEARLSTVMRSAAWIDTEVRNQAKPANFVMAGEEL